MKPSEIKKSIEKAILKSNREDQKSQGYFDGRFNSRVFKDRKREQSKKACRTKTQNIF
jgi:hypothetical protein